MQTQFTLTLSIACSLDKAQIISLSKAVVSLNLCKRKTLQSGQVYVGNFGGVYLTGSYNRALMKTNVAAKDEYKRLKLHQLITPILTKYSEKLS